MRRTKRVGPVTKLLVDEDSACESTTLPSTSLDLSIQPRVPRYTKSKVTHKDLFARLPNELFDSILKRFEVPNLIPLRLVSTRWNGMIESMCHKVKSLALASRDFAFKLHERFGGQLDLSQLVYLELKPKYFRSTLLTHLRTLLQLFANVEHLFMDRFIFQHDCYILVGLFCRLSNRLVTLYFDSKIILVQHIRPCSFSLALVYSILNRMTNLKNLHLPNQNDLSFVSLVPTLQRLHSFSFGLSHSQPQVTCDELVNHLGPHCTSLTVNVLSEHCSLFDCLTWPIRTAQSPITHLHLNAFVPHLENFIFRVFPEHFAATLASLHITNLLTYPKLNLSSSTINSAMSHFTQLSEIRIDGPTRFILSRFCLRDAPTPMANIRSFSLYNFWLFCSAPNSEELFCQFFSTIFPNLERLTLHYQNPSFGENIRPFLDLFKALSYHDISYVE